MVYFLLLIIFLLILTLVYSKYKCKNIFSQLKQSDDNFSLFFDSSLEAVVLWDNAKNIIRANQNFSELSSYAIEETHGMNIFDFIEPVEYDNLHSKIFQNESQEHELQFTKKDGSQTLVLIKQSEIVYDNQKVTVWFILDLSKIKQKEIELAKLNSELSLRVKHEVQANREKDRSIIEKSRLAQMGEMISMIAHQWRQPLTAISATCNNLILQSMNKKTLDSDLVIEELSLVTNYTQYLSDTIDDFRNFFKQNKHKELTSVDQIINETLKIVSSTIENSNIKLTLQLNCPIQIETYSGEIKQVILNIIKNAQDALLLNHILNPEIVIETSCTNDTFVEILISDNAKGIPLTILDKIFEPYFSTKKELDGTGLGLYMSKIIVEKNCNGKLNAANVHSGAIFSIQLPINNN